MPTERKGAARTVDSDPIERCLAAILSADAVGYSRPLAKDKTVRVAEP